MRPPDQADWVLNRLGVGAAAMRIGQHEVADHPPPVAERSGEGDARRCTRYVITDHEHGPFFDNALDSGWFDVVYEDDDCSVLRIRDEKGDPPPDNLPPGEQPDQTDDESEESGV